MFEKKDFISHAGLFLRWKIDCDTLTKEDYECLAYIIGEKFLFSSVYGVPRGGIKFAEALKPYCSEFGPRLVVDDVLTTGTSMIEAKENENDIGIVIFSRAGVVPYWITPIFRMESVFLEV